MRDAVCDTSPLQYLYQVQLLELLPNLVRHVIVPQAVIREIEAGRRRGYNVPEVSSRAWVEVREPTSAPVPLFNSELGLGEIEVIRLSLETPGAVAVLDDRAAREEAARLGIPVAGTLRILVLLKQHGLIDAVSPWIGELRLIGFWASDVAVNAALHLAGESTTH